MLIVCTKDQGIRNWAQNPQSEAGDWGRLCLMNSANNRNQATQELEHLISQLGDTESLCIHAHGNDDEIGDSGNTQNDWGWSYQALAAIFQKMRPGYKGKIVMRSCGQGIDNFSSRFRVELERLKVLKGAWIYGQNRSQDIQRPYAKPNNLDKDVTLQPALVNY